MFFVYLSQKLRMENAFIFCYTRLIFEIEHFKNIGKDCNDKLHQTFSCSWRGKPCDMEDFEQVFTDLGICYTFNGQGHKHYVEEEGSYTIDSTRSINISMISLLSTGSD